MTLFRPQKYTRILAMIVISLIMCITCILVAVYVLPLRSTAHAVQMVTEFNSGTRTLFIPNIYLNKPEAGASDGTGLLETAFPGDQPHYFATDSKENISILFFDTRYRYDGKEPDTALTNLIGPKLESNNVVFSGKEEFGLRHYSQKVPEKAYMDDVWLSDGTIIVCSDRQWATQILGCIQYFSNDNYLFKVRYQRFYLPDWNIIKSHVLSLFEKFETKDTAEKLAHQYQ
ncbi:hypothetical protein GOL99_17725 [Sinorhizobium medicae]|nr:hypothetical protein [Sinorhizobium medicae]